MQNRDINEDIIMVVRKKAPKKPKLTTEEVLQAPPEIVSFPEPVKLQIEAAPTDDSLEPTPTSAAMDMDEKDYGLGIGDILGDVKKSSPAKDSSLSSQVFDEDRPADDRRSIESILQDQNDEPKWTYKPSPVVSGQAKGNGKMLVLAALMVLCFSAAAGGVYMFVVKNGAPGMPAFMSGMFSKKTNAPAAVIDDPSAMPESINAVVVLSSREIKDESRPVILTRVIETDIKRDGTFSATGEAVTSQSSSKATGKATIVNESDQTYTFVATTRLLSKDGVLLRMISGSKIPANGSVTVDVRADQPGPGGDIGPTTFTIPGLPPATQKFVYAKSDAPMSGGGNKSRLITEQDITNAKLMLNEKVKDEARENLKALLVEGEILNEDLITSNELLVSAPAVGTATSEFTVSVSIRYRAMLVPEKMVSPLLDSALSGALPLGSSAADYSLGLPLYAVEAYDTSAEKAELRIEVPVIRR